MSEPLPPEVKERIRIVERHISSTPLSFLLGECCKINEDEVYDISRQQNTAEAVMEEALQRKGPPPSDQEKLFRLFKAVSEKNRAIIFDYHWDQVLAEYEQEKSRKDPVYREEYGQDDSVDRATDQLNRGAKGEADAAREAISRGEKK